MAILVTGGAGYIGAHMVWELLEHGEEVVVLDNLTTGFEWAVPKQAKLIVGDIGDGEFVEAVLRDEKIEGIIHFAGSVVVPESVEKPLMYYDNNTSKSRVLVEAAVNTGVKKFIFSSTAAVYGTPTSTGPISEDAALNPMSPYGSSKLMTEVMIRDTANAHDLSYVMLRYFNVAGCDPLGRTGQSTDGATHLIKVACEAAAGTRPSMNIFGTDYDTPDGSCVRDYIHVSDLVAAHYSALQFLRGGGESFTANCGYSKGYSVLEVIDAVKRVSGSDFKVVNSERRAGDAVSVVANADRLRENLSWSPQYDDLEKIVKTALAWEKKLQDFRKNA